MKSLFFILSFVISVHTFAFENDIYLKAGINMGVGRIGTFEIEPGDDDKEIAAHNYFGSYGFNTHVGYRWKRYELSASSTIFFGKVNDLSFKVNDNKFTGSGNYQNLMVYPTLKYFIPWEPLNSWRIAAGVSPIFSQQTVRLKEFISTGPFQGNKFKLTYDSVGWGVSLGFEEHLELKEMHPVYIEISYFSLYSVKSYLVDTTDPTKTNILSSQTKENDVGAETFMISMGIVLF
ncbi:hypothetical protein [Halobacteriovorax sp. HLS]|uniref:hypothetical protein n=1 Tax=Halobacteriovorax sp. HLS TaxID=2234000 RepID=UPI000FDAFEFF|nr:hypothetical protein [Halobacteriovorax sp. HLS]